MTKRLFIVTIPGIGSIKDDYTDKMEADIKRYSRKTSLKGNYEVIKTRPYVENKIDENQEALFTRINEHDKLGGVLSLRKLVMKTTGDAVTFEHKAYEKDSNYRKIHASLKLEFEDIYKKMQAYDDAIFVILASSMGAHILSTYIWDADNKVGIFADEPATKKNNLKNLNYLATIGCNIPLFVSGYKESDIKAFDKRNSGFTWDNYYDRDDVLGWPLQHLSDSYGKLVTDHEINTGVFLGSHVRYWSDNDFTKPFTKKLCDLYG